MQRECAMKEVLNGFGAHNDLPIHMYLLRPTCHYL